MRVSLYQQQEMLLYCMMLGLILAWLVVVAVAWLGWQVLRQNGRILLRLDELEQRLDAIEFGERSFVGKTATSKGANGHQGLAADTAANRFSNHSLAQSKIKRDGLKAGTAAPDFSLPRLNGRGDLSLSDLRGRKVLLVFSSPGCGPCNSLAPELERLHRDHPELDVVMISKGEPKENRAKVKEHGLTFPIVLQQQWEISRRYAMFATPVAYRINEIGIITHDVALGMEAILELGKTVGVEEVVGRG